MKNAYQQLFREQDFIDRLIEARDSCNKTHAETGFTVARNTFRRDAQYPEDRDYVVNGVQFGDEGGINLSSENYGILDGTFTFLDLHFHGEIGKKASNAPGAISADDFADLNIHRMHQAADTGVVTSPLSLVGFYGPNGKISLLAVQEKSEGALSFERIRNAWRYYDNNIDVTKPVESLKDLKDVQEVIRKTGEYNAETLVLHNGEFSAEMLRRLGTFKDKYKINESIWTKSQDFFTEEHPIENPLEDIIDNMF